MANKLKRKGDKILAVYNDILLYEREYETLPIQDRTFKTQKDIAKKHEEKDDFVNDLRTGRAYGALTGRKKGNDYTLKKYGADQISTLVKENELSNREIAETIPGVSRHIVYRQRKKIATSRKRKMPEPKTK